MKWALVLAILFGLGPRVGLPVRSKPPYEVDPDSTRYPTDIESADAEQPSLPSGAEPPDPELCRRRRDEIANRHSKKQKVNHLPQQQQLSNSCSSSSPHRAPQSTPTVLLPSGRPVGSLRAWKGQGLAECLAQQAFAPATAKSAPKAAPASAASVQRQQQLITEKSKPQTTKRPRHTAAVQKAAAVSKIFVNKNEGAAKAIFYPKHLPFGMAVPQLSFAPKAAAAPSHHAALQPAATSESEVAAKALEFSKQPPEAPKAPAIAAPAVPAAPAVQCGPAAPALAVAVPAPQDPAEPVTATQEAYFEALFQDREELWAELRRVWEYIGIAVPAPQDPAQPVTATPEAYFEALAQDREKLWAELRRVWEYIGTPRT